MTESIDPKSEWFSRYRVPPCGYFLRGEADLNWLRIHSLPRSKRYADTPAEWTELLRRQNTVATRLLGESSSCIVYVRTFEHTSDWSLRNSAWWSRHDFKMLDEQFPLYEGHPDRDLDDPEDREADIRFAIAPTQWNSGKFDDLIRAVADDETESVTFLSLTTGQVYAPYDGGADLFFQTEGDEQECRSEWHAWLSDHPCGL